MEQKESIILGFLILVILVLIFSKITVGSTTDETALIANELKKIEDKIASTNPTISSNVASNSSSVSNTQTSSSFDLHNSELLSPEFKKQYDELQNRFYYDNCRYSRL